MTPRHAQSTLRKQNAIFGRSLYWANYALAYQSPYSKEEIELAIGAGQLMKQVVAKVYFKGKQWLRALEQTPLSPKEFDLEVTSCYLDLEENTRLLIPLLFSASGRQLRRYRRNEVSHLDGTPCNTAPGDVWCRDGKPFIVSGNIRDANTVAMRRIPLFSQPAPKSIPDIRHWTKVLRKFLGDKKFKQKVVGDYSNAIFFTRLPNGSYRELHFSRSRRNFVDASEQVYPDPIWSEYGHAISLRVDQLPGRDPIHPSLEQGELETALYQIQQDDESHRMIAIARKMSIGRERQEQKGKAFTHQRQTISLARQEMRRKRLSPPVKKARQENAGDLQFVDTAPEDHTYEPPAAYNLSIEDYQTEADKLESAKAQRKLEEKVPRATESPKSPLGKIISLLDSKELHQAERYLGIRPTPTQARRS